MAEEDDSPIPEERFTPEPDASSSPEGAPGNGGLDEDVALAINGQYIKDLSFEAPHTPEIYNDLQTEMPEIKVDIDVGAEAKAESLFEVMIKCRAEARIDDKLVYLTEIEYAGLFTINVEPEALGPVLLIECPLILFPFMRRIISDLTGDGGFAPLMLSPIDFAALYQQRMMQAAEEAEAEEAAGGGATEET
ncbi:MAG: protein-export chaperone SecB [Rhodospirillaceae bacterium]|mgnify:FL=1|jgi:preprotein translocase subunit SecB|nr:protein-export chaperone SecB [Rhodospirillaceae bacterium]MBT3886164.1 protein-export chaperone SecB [Rhodospirillaceae bacterium]MBT4118235.1 protein-export chaperone SecB [Rhodospirillaceae bacterium]MBT4673078.1 protein-export chaperone SecB [Rhodospirillaceae bacterium]MBT4721320.1 protein-export chaperone SecB [Rhodospirillaceae bacterium]